MNDREKEWGLPTDLLVLASEMWSPARPPPRKIYEQALSQLRAHSHPESKIISVVGKGKIRNLPGRFFEEVEKEQTILGGQENSLSSGLSFCEASSVWVFSSKASIASYEHYHCGGESVVLIRKPKHKNWSVGLGLSPSGEVLNFSYGMPYNWLGAVYLAEPELGLLRKVVAGGSAPRYIHECLNEVIALGGVFRPLFVVENE